MLKCILIYLWLYCGLFHLIEASDDDEHVHIKLHMPSGGQRKRAQHHQQHHKKRHASPASHHHHKHYHHNPQSHSIIGPPPPPPPPPPSTSSSTVNHIKNLPQHSHESGQTLTLEEEIYGAGGGDDGAGDGFDTNSEEPLMIPSYLTTNFALFPQPTATYETEIIPQNNEGFNVVDHHHHHYDNNGGVVLEAPGLDNEITAPAAVAALKGSSLETQFLLNEQQHQLKQQQLDKTIKNEQLLQQLLQQQLNQQHNEKREIINSASKLRAHKYKDSEDDMKEDMLYSSILSSSSTRQPTDSAHSGTLKALTVNDIWSQLQRQYLNKYAPQAQPLASNIGTDSAEEQLPPAATTATSTRSKRKRNTKRPKHSKTNSASIHYHPESYSTSSFSWPTKTLTLASNHHHKQPKRQPFYDDNHSSSLSHASSSQHTTREGDLFAGRPRYKSYNPHIVTDTSVEDGSDDSSGDEDADAEEDIANNEDIYGNGAYNTGNGVNHPDDESYEETVYQRGKKFTGHTAYGHFNPFNYHDLYGSYSTPVTATVATKLQPSTYHPNLLTPSTIGSGSGSYTPTTAQTSAFLPTLQQPSTSYQWRTQQNYPISYQTYHMQHQWPAADEARQHSHTQSSALRSPKATITQTPNSILATHTNDFTSPSSSSSLSSSPASSFASAIRSTLQTPTTVKTSSRYKKRKNRTKTKRNRIVVI